MQSSKFSNTLRQTTVGVLIVCSLVLLAGCSSPDDKKQAVIIMQESTSVGGTEKIEMLQQARVLDKTNPEIIQTLAREALKQGAFEVAIKNYSRLEGIAGFEDAGKLGRIEVALVQGDEEGASQIVQGYSDSALNSERLVDIGAVYYNNNFLLEASNLYERAITADVKNANAWANMGVVQADLGELEMAKEFADEASRLDPTNTTIQFNRATLLGDLAFQARKEGAESTIYVVEALKILDTILETTSGSDSQEISLYKAVLLLENSDFDQSKEILEGLTTSFPKYKDAWYYKGLVYKELGEEDSARDAFLEVMSLDPSHPRAAQELIDLGVE